MVWIDYAYSLIVTSHGVINYGIVKVWDIYDNPICVVKGSIIGYKISRGIVYAYPKIIIEACVVYYKIHIRMGGIDSSSGTIRSSIVNYDISIGIMEDDSIISIWESPIVNDAAVLYIIQY